MLYGHVVTALRTLQGWTPNVLATAIIFGALSAAPAQAQGDAGEGTEHPLRAGAWALEFQVQPSLYSYPSSAGLAIKRHLSARSAIRLGTLVGITHSDTDGTSKVDRAFPYDTVLTTAKVEDDYDRRDVTLFLHWLRFLGVSDRFGMFLEVGPTVRWASEEYARVDAFPSPMGTYSHTGDSDSWSYGLEMAAGFEWFFARRLGLSGRYGVSALLVDKDRTDAFDFYNPNDGAWDRRLDVTHSKGSVTQTTPAVISLTAYF